MSCTSSCFMGFPENITRNPTIESYIIIGLLDGGIASDSPFFSDEGFNYVPKKWKGVCQTRPYVACNKKLIGSKTYSTYNVDDDGHGTHTASITAGNYVKGASFYSIAEGVARGGVPSARIAMYKVCRAGFGCDGYNILAAFDGAIADGVNILSVSLGSNGGSPPPGVVDVLTIGSFHALERGIFTVHSAGNDGPDYGSVYSSVPWLLSLK